MNTKDFVQVLKKVIKEEVKAAVHEAIKELSSDNLIESVVNKQKPNYSLKPEYNYKPKKQPATKQFTKDPLLNSLLNETAVSGFSIPPDSEHNDFSEWPTMEMDNSYSSLMGSPKFVTNKINAIPDGINPNAVPEEVKGALTRDYRSLMKAINKKKGN